MTLNKSLAGWGLLVVLGLNLRAGSWVHAWKGA